MHQLSQVSRLLPAVGALLLWCAPASGGEPCTPQWAEQMYCLQGIDFGGQAAIGRAFAVFDDGTGPALYLGGTFLRAGCFDLVNNIVKWDGIQFTPLIGIDDAVGVTGGDAKVNALTVFDDGTGPALYLAGQFGGAGGVQLTNIARWNGVSFSQVGGTPNFPPVINGEILTMCVSPDGGSLVIGGQFTSVSGAGTVNRVARWNGSEWTSFESAGGLGVSGTVRALTTFDDGDGPALYVAGDFQSASGVTVNRIAKWTGSGWEQLEGPGGIGVDQSVFSLTTHDDGSGTALYAGGSFITAGGVTVNRIARWDGIAWSALTAPGGVGVSATVRAMSTYDDRSGSALFIGSGGLTAGGVTINNFGRWDGTNWTAATGPWSTGVTGGVINALAVHDDGAGAGSAIYATGTFPIAGGLYAAQSARWNGDEWSILVSPQVSGVTTVSSSVETMLAFDDGHGESLYFGGGFTNVAGQLVNRIARWDGENYSALSGPQTPGMNLGLVYTLAAHDDGSGAALYAGGTFTASGDVTTNRIAKWDGEGWSALSGPNGTGVNGIVWSSAVYDDGSGPALYVGGQFVTAGGITVNRVAKWNGAAWSALEGPNGIGLTSPVGTVTAYAMTVFDDGTGPALYVGGRFEEAGGETVNHIARWDGSEWTPLATRDGVGIDVTSGSTSVRALAVYDDGSGPALYVGGNFTTIGGAIVNTIARWDGKAWTSIESNGQIGTSGSWVYSLHAHDHGDGNGPGLYVGGTFLTAGGQSVNRIARWDGANWTPLDGPNAPGLGEPVETGGVLSMASFDDGSGDGVSLFAGGGFLTAGGVASRFIAKWTGCGGASPAIPGDFNGDGVVDGADLGVMLFSWGPCVPQEPCPADLNGDGVVDGADLGILLFNWS